MYQYKRSRERFKGKYVFVFADGLEKILAIGVFLGDKEYKQ